MTNKERRYLIQRIKENKYLTRDETNYIVKALEQELCEDCVSRQQALKELKESAEHHANDSREEALLRRDRDIIRALPPVTPIYKTAPTLRNYEDYHDAEQYTKGWNDAMHYIFDSEEEKRKKAETEEKK